MVIHSVEIRNKLKTPMSKTLKRLRFLTFEIRILKSFQISDFEFRFFDLVKLVNLFLCRSLWSKHDAATINEFNHDVTFQLRDLGVKLVGSLHGPLIQLRDVVTSF